MRRLLDSGASMGAATKRWGSPLQVLMENNALDDDELAPWYDAIFAAGGINWDVPASRGRETTRTLAEKIEQWAEACPHVHRRMKEPRAQRS